MTHPNLFPVDCADMSEMQILANQMRKLCLANPDKLERYEASSTEEEFQARSVSVREDIVKSGNLRFIRYPDGRVVNVVLTLLFPEDGEKEWNLSMSHATLAGPLRVEDDLASMICEAFLREDYSEVSPKSFHKNVRHFVATCKTIERVEKHDSSNK